MDPFLSLYSSARNYAQSVNKTIVTQYARHHNQDQHLPCTSEVPAMVSQETHRRSNDASEAVENKHYRRFAHCPVHNLHTRGKPLI